MLQFLVSNAINTPTITSNEHTLYGVEGGTPLHNRCDRRTSIAWPNAKFPLRDQMPNATVLRYQCTPNFIIFKKKKFPHFQIDLIVIFHLKKIIRKKIDS